MTHNVTITEGDNPKYPLLVSCSCSYQCHCKTDEEAQFRKRQHQSSALWLEATKGFQIGHR